MLKLQKLRFEVSGQPIDLDISTAVANSLASKSNTSVYNSTEALGSASVNGAGTSSTPGTTSSTFQVDQNRPIMKDLRSNSNPNFAGGTASGRTSPRVSHARSSQIGKLFKAFSFSSRQGSESSLKSTGSISSIIDIGPDGPASDAFGYIRSDSSITRDKVQYLIAETQRKLEIEEEVKEGAQKMMEASANMHNMPESKSMKADLTSKITECTDKIFIFQKALTHFHSLELVKTEFFGKSRVIEE